MKKWLGIMAIFGFWLLVLTFGLEFWARKKYGTVCVLPHSIYHHEFVAGRNCTKKNPEFVIDYEINSLSLRNDEVQIPKPSGVKRVLMLGDSFTEGVGAKQNETFSYLVNEMMGNETEVINAGISANAPILMNLWLQNVGLGLQPDLIILNINESDFSETQKFMSSQVKVDGEVIAIPGKPIKYLPEFLRLPLQANSRFYGYFNAQVLNKIFQARARNRKSERVEAENKKERGGIFVMSKGIDRDEYLKLLGPMVEDLNKINALLRVRKIPMIVVLQPFGHHVSPTAWPGRQKHGLEMDAVYNPAYFEHFQSLSFDVLDLRNSFINYNNTDSLFYDQDGHWTKDGHKLVAEVIYDFLLKTNY